MDSDSGYAEGSAAAVMLPSAVDMCLLAQGSLVAFKLPGLATHIQHYSYSMYKTSQDSDPVIQELLSCMAVEHF